MLNTHSPKDILVNASAFYGRQKKQRNPELFGRAEHEA
jgi:hypothetical protein